MNKNDTLNYIRELNEKYIANNCNGISNTGKNFKLIHGSLPILLSAPHAVRQSRNGQIKGADTLTGPIVEFLCERTCTNGIIRISNLGDDPNSENTGYGLEYKKAILDFAERTNIKCLIDIHGCGDNHPFDIDIGTNNGININYNNSFLNIIYEQLSSIGKATIDHTFKASKDITVCNYISKNTNIPCFQIELSTSLRETLLLQLLDRFKIVIDNLARQIELDKNDKQFEI